MADNAIDLTAGDFTVESGTFGPGGVYITGVGPYTLTVNLTRGDSLSIGGISGVEPGAGLHVIANSGTTAFWAEQNPTDTLAYFDADLSGGGWVSASQTVLSAVEGPIEVTFGAAKNANFTYTIEPGVTTGDIKEIDVYGMGANGSIQVGTFYDPPSGRSLSYDPNTEILKISFISHDVVFNVHDVSATDAATFMSNPHLYTDYQSGMRMQLPERGPVCFLKGTLIETTTGPKAVEDLIAGMAVIGSTGTRVVKWIGYRSDNVRSIAEGDREKFLPIRIRTGAVGDNVPNRDLLVSPGHHIYVNGYLIRAVDLVNGRSITQLQPSTISTIEYFHIELDQFDLVVSNGLLSESWGDGGNRNFFHNAEITELRPASVQRRLAPRPGFDHLVLRKGKKLDAIRARLLKLANENREVTSEKAKAA